MIRNGKCLRISHIGEGEITNGTTTLPLKNGLLVHSIKKSLLSVFKLTTDYLCYFVFDGNEFKFKDMKTSRVLASGIELAGCTSWMVSIKRHTSLIGFAQWMKMCGTKDLAIHKGEFLHFLRIMALFQLKISPMLCAQVVR